MEIKERREKIAELKVKMIELDEAGTLAKPKLAYGVLLRMLFLIEAIILEGENSNAQESE